MEMPAGASAHPIGGVGDCKDWKADREEQFGSNKMLVTLTGNSEDDAMVRLSGTIAPTFTASWVASSTLRSGPRIGSRMGNTWP
jgi:hypothetical protein